MPAIAATTTINTVGISENMDKYDETIDQDSAYEELQEVAAEETSAYVPRPAWQVWLARVALVLFLIIVIGQALRIARGGL